MIRTGLVSVTFRRLDPHDIIRLAAEAKLAAIEWGSDVHVPPGKTAVAKEVNALTHDAGLDVAAYGSYYRVAAQMKNTAPFEQILETAVALGAPLIRVWASDRSSEKAYDSHWNTLITETQAIADQAVQANVGIAFEYHGNTMNDTPDATRRLIKGVDRPNVWTLWQPDGRSGYQECWQSLRKVRPWLANIHVFHWHMGQRLLLEEGENEWQGFLDLVADSGKDHCALLEFVQKDQTHVFMKDAAILNGLAKVVQNKAALSRRK